MMKLYKIILFSFIIAVFFQVLLLAQNPFVRPGRKMPDHTAAGIEKKNVCDISYPMFIKRLLAKIAKIQKKLNKKMSGLFKELQEKKSTKAILILLLVSFIYGVLHAVGPGHGKTVVFSYFISQKAHVIDGILSGVFIGVLHAFSAIFVIFIIYVIVKASYLSHFEHINIIVRMISALLIMGIGLFLLIKTILRRNRKEQQIQPDNAVRKNFLSLIAIAASVGMVPCPGAAIILLFAINKGVIPFGIFSVVFMSIGMALTISIVAVITIKTKHLALSFPEKESKVYKGIVFSMQIIGNFLVILFGGLLLLTSI